MIWQKWLLGEPLRKYLKEILSVKKHGCQKVWLIVVRLTLKISSETSGVLNQYSQATVCRWWLIISLSAFTQPTVARWSLDNQQSLSCLFFIFTVSRRSLDAQIITKKHQKIVWPIINKIIIFLVSWLKKQLKSGKILADLPHVTAVKGSSWPSCDKIPFVKITPL